MSRASPVEDGHEPSLGGPPRVAYVATLVTYVALGFFLKSVVLNWIVGPLVPLIVLYLVPRLLRSRASTRPG